MSNSLTDLKRGELRTKAEHELIATEKTYVAFMTALVEVFVQPLEAWFQKIKFRNGQQGGQHGVLEQILAQEPNIIEDLFANLPQLAEFNARFLADIKAAKRSQGSVAGALEQSIPNLKIYSTFISNYDRSMTLLKRIEEDPRAHAFLSACELQKGCGGLDLRSLLIQPVQRIPRYRLLLSEILKYTTRDDPERPKLQRALELVMQVAATINDNIAKEKGRRRLLEVQAMYGTAQFARPTRYVVRDGLLQKVCRNGKRRFHFILFNDAIAYGTEAVLKKNQYKLNREINLYDLLVVDAGSLDQMHFHSDEPRGRASSDPPPVMLTTSPGGSSHNNRNIIVVSREKSFVIQCDTEQAARDWKVDLCSCMIRSNGIAPPKGPPVTEFEIWMPNNTGSGTSRQRFMIPEDVDMSTGMVHISELISVDALANDADDSDDEGDSVGRNSESEHSAPGMANRIRRSMTPMRMRSISTTPVTPNSNTAEEKRVESLAAEKRNLFARIGLGGKSKDKEQPQQQQPQPQPQPQPHHLPPVMEVPAPPRRNSTGSELDHANDGQHFRRSSLDDRMIQRPLPPSPPRNISDVIPPTPIRQPNGPLPGAHHVRQPSPVDGPPPPVPPRRPSGTGMPGGNLAGALDGVERAPPLVPSRPGSLQNVLAADPAKRPAPEPPNRRPPTPPARELIDHVAMTINPMLVANRTPMLFTKPGPEPQRAAPAPPTSASTSNATTTTSAHATSTASTNSTHTANGTTHRKTGTGGASGTMPPPQARPPTAEIKPTPIKQQQTTTVKANRAKPPRPLSDSSDSQSSSIGESKGIVLQADELVSKAIRAARVAQAKKQYSGRGANLKRGGSDEEPATAPVPAPSPAPAKSSLDSLRGELSPTRGSPDKNGALSPGRGRTKVTPVKVTDKPATAGTAAPGAAVTRARPVRPPEAPNGTATAARQAKSSTLPNQLRKEAGEFNAVKRAAKAGTASNTTAATKGSSGTAARAAK